MQNIDIAKIFWEISELMELQEENVFKIRAYQKVARNVENLQQNLREIYDRGGLKALESIPGIGKSIALHIEELFKTDKIEKHQALLKKFPHEFMKLLEIPGVGPKTAILLREKFGIKSMDDLEKALKSGILKDLPGFREKKQENLKKGIELKKKNHGRFLISEAIEYAEAIVSELKKLKEIDQILVAGSLRRQKETIGDIDILVTSKKPSIVMDFFVKLSCVHSVAGKGETKTSVVLKNGMKADVRVLGPENFGAAAHYFTGSKLHNIAIREMAIKKGLKISEYGVFHGKKIIAGLTEEEVFASVGLPYIPPEIREDMGEFEAAKKGTLPDLIKLSDIKGDLHIHSTYSDGNNTIEEMVEYSMNKGYSYIAITDHTVSTRIAGGQTAKEVLKEFEHIDKLNSKLHGFRILKGVELDILKDGSLDLPSEILKECDVVSASVHSNFKMNSEDMTKRIAKAIQNKYVNILSHPTGRIIGKRDPYEVNIEEVLKIAADNGTFMEVNAYPERLDLKDVHCRRAKELGIKIAINTDAHAVAHLKHMRYGVATARRGWLEKKDVINTLPINKLIMKLQQKR